MLFESDNTVLDYPLNQSPAVPMSPSSTDDWEFPALNFIYTKCINPPLPCDMK